ncbi:hypothetical protein CVT25_011242 [Psilocybe cyanescens]|uniref:F-box domain-containing protein n=1 Tax=Psilocybe cyanescens TaxID=93625 RepID=A0A409VWM9_PSICY|nr:hypothetical protein CVT25_011242 [Psilocybe cyanescens]
MPIVDSKDIPTLLISNVEPDPSVIPIILSTIKNIDSDLSKPHRTLKYRTQARREEIRKEKKTLTEIRSRYTSVLSAVRKLSDALWARIFGYNAEDKRELAAYMLVCYNWNIVAGYFAHHWNNIDVKLYYDEPRGSIQIKDAALIARHFERARPLPIDVTVDYGFNGGHFYKSNRVLKELPNKNQWRSLRTGPSVMIILMRRHSREEFPRLEEIKLRSKKGVEEMRICGLSLRGLSFLTRLTIEVEDRIHKGFEGGINVPWHQLTHLKLDGTYSEASDYLDILAASLFVEVCNLKLSRSPHPSRRLPVRKGTRLSMPKLRELTINGEECPVPFLSFLTAPRLETLSVGWKEKSAPGSKPGQGIADFILASECKLRTFKLTARDIFFSDLGRALRAMDSVEDITLRISNSRSIPIIDRLLHEDGQAQDATDSYAARPFLPSLSSIAIHSVQFALPLSWFVMYAQPKRLVLEDPVREPHYEELDCVSCIYEDESLLVISAHKDVSKGILSNYINADDPNVDISYN